MPAQATAATSSPRTRFAVANPPKIVLVATALIGRADAMRGWSMRNTRNLLAAMLITMGVATPALADPIAERQELM